MAGFILRRCVGDYFYGYQEYRFIGLVLGNYMFITLAILTGMIYKMRQSIGIQGFLIKKHVRLQANKEKSMRINIL